jgi:hypothetical protein
VEAGALRDFLTSVYGVESIFSIDKHSCDNYATAMADTKLLLHRSKHRKVGAELLCSTRTTPTVSAVSPIGTPSPSEWHMDSVPTAERGSVRMWALPARFMCRECTVFFLAAFAWVLMEPVAHAQSNPGLSVSIAGPASGAVGQPIPIIWNVHGPFIAQCAGVFTGAWTVQISWSSSSGCTFDNSECDGFVPVGDPSPLPTSGVYLWTPGAPGIYQIRGNA